MLLNFGELVFEQTGVIFFQNYLRLFAISETWRESATKFWIDVPANLEKQESRRNAEVNLHRK